MTSTPPRRAWRHPVAPDANAVDYLQLFLVAGITAILAIRGYLAATGYPQVGGGGLHIAHMLWGGLLMLVALFLALAVLGTTWKRTIALVGGAGFGVFIDELGKFITEDNNYFFKPTVAIIYVIFVLLYLGIGFVSRRVRLSSEDRLANALDAVQRLAKGSLTDGRRDHALFLLSQADTGDPLVRQVRAILESAEVVADGRPSVIRRIQRQMARAYRSVTQRPLFRRAISVVVILQASLLVLSAVAVAIFDGSRFAAGDMSLAERGQLLSTLLATFFAARGLLNLIVRRTWLGALFSFERSVLTSILLVQVFTFNELQWGALTGLTINLIELGLIRFGITQERTAALRSGQAKPSRDVARRSKVAVAS